ncbi:MAG TPA: hypothetical protein VFU05_06140, partial [Cyclobacteriaceae bacterium]|nr:hypothetical protein [Cyclobacteriaceae bacterium]
RCSVIGNCNLLSSLFFDILVTNEYNFIGFHHTFDFMTIFRNTLAVIIGYATFVISAVLYFQLSGADPHADASTTYKIVTVVYGLIFSFLGGLLTQLISKSNKLTINYVLAAIIAGFATFSLIKTSGDHYSQFAAIILFAPASILGGLTYLKRIKK